MKPHTRRPPPPPPSSAPPRVGGMAPVLKIVAGVTAVLSLAFAVRQASVYITDYRQKRRHVSELLVAAEIQRNAHDYRAAWAGLREAASSGDNATVQAARENLAMTWLDDARGSNGLTLGGIADTVVPVLSRGLAGAQGARRGDLLAHLGWAHFFKWRDGQRQLDPAAQYREALVADSGNPYAHAMLAHWVLWNHGSVAEANGHFAAALASGRERHYVRHLQLAAFDNLRDDSRDTNLISVANDMRIGGDSIDPGGRDKLWTPYYAMMRTGRPGRVPDRLDATLSPEELLLTYRWLFATSSYVESKGFLYTIQLARLEEAAGDSVSALASYRTALGQAMDGYADRRAALDAAIVRLASSR